MKHPWRIIYLKTVDSTNNYANLLLSENLQFEEHVIAAENQTHGRGQKNNIWLSQEAENLTFSIVLNTNYIAAENQFQLSQIVSLSIIDFLNYYEIQAFIKWPNDILIGTKKIAGILIENSVMGTRLYSSIVGIGINVNQTDFEHSLEATSMKLLQKEIFDRNLLLDQLLNCIYKKLEQLKANNYENLKKQYLEKLFRFNEWVTFLVNDKPIKAKILDVSEFGELVILSDNGKMTKHMFQEIKMILAK